MDLKQNIKKACFVFTVLSLACDSGDSNIESSNNQTIEIRKTLTLGGAHNESAQSIVSTPDGGYAVLGYTQSMDADVSNKTNTSYDFWLLKFDTEGQQQWQHIYGGNDDDRGQEIINTSDGGYAILGSSRSEDGDVSENAGSNDFWMVKLNPFGIIEWEKSFGYSGLDNGFSILQTQDQGFLLTGVLDVTASEGEGNTNRLNTSRHAGGDYWVIKLDQMGELQWRRYYGGNFTDTAYAAAETQAENFIIVGSSDSDDVDINNNKGSYDFWVLKLSNDGTLLWEKSFGGSEIDEAKDITMTSDGNFLIVGNTRSHDTDVSLNNGAADVWVVKINPDGELLWEKTFGGSSFDSAQAIHKTPNNDYIIAGNSRSSDIDLIENKGQNDAWFFKIDSEGALQSQVSVGGSNIDLLMDVVALENGRIVVVGNSGSADLNIPENKGFTDLLIIETKP